MFHMINLLPPPPYYRSKGVAKESLEDQWSDISHTSDTVFVCLLVCQFAFTFHLTFCERVCLSVCLCSVNFLVVDFCVC